LELLFLQDLLDDHLEISKDYLYLPLFEFDQKKVVYLLTIENSLMIEVYENKQMNPK
tara:strand:+ start:959 stop:1129 length:171 start_codon:yes stop_codon:yes gene_type:complete